MAKSSVTMRMDEELKFSLQDLLDKLGMDMTTFFTISAKQAIREQRIPFAITLDVPNAETVEAMEETKAMEEHPEDYKGYTDVDQMMKELLA